MENRFLSLPSDVHRMIWKYIYNDVVADINFNRNTIKLNAYRFSSQLNKYEREQKRKQKLLSSFTFDYEFEREYKYNINKDIECNRFMRKFIDCRKFA